MQVPFFGALRATASLHLFENSQGIPFRNYSRDTALAEMLGFVLAATQKQPRAGCSVDLAITPHRLHGKFRGVLTGKDHIESCVLRQFARFVVIPRDGGVEACAFKHMLQDGEYIGIAI